MKLAFVYDRVNKFGGAERVLEALHEIWPEAPLFTSVFDPDGASWAKDWDIRTSWLQRFPWARKNHEAFGWLMPSVFESMDFSGFDVVISVTSEAAKGIITTPGQLHVCYLLTPTRYLWSHALEYLEELPFIARPLALALQSKLRIWDFAAAQRPDQIISISKLVQARCRKYYRRESEVTHPPAGLAQSTWREAGTSRERNYFLVVSRLVPYKKVNLAIEACNRLKENLVIVGIGSDRPRLKSLAGPTIRFVGNLTDDELVGYYRGAKALLMPQEEDFGLTGIEAQICGTPVISYRQSGAPEYIVQKKTGVLFDEQTTDSLLEAMKTLDDLLIDPGACVKNSLQYAPDRFKRQFQHEIEILWKKTHH